MPKDPVFSFIIPVFKKPPEVFERCLASLFDMSLKEIEVLCVFDGEDKELEAVARTYSKALCFTIEHGGAPKARNYGSQMAKGRYIACWDADCVAKPEMAARWLQEFEATNADFVYAGYEFSGERGGYPSEPFDVYSLQCGNYISTMFPIKREKAPKWDETLAAAQDWDFWLTAVEQGCVGSYIEGASFITEPSFLGSISAEGWSPEKRKETIRVIREKHGIPERKAAVCSYKHFLKALHIAKMMQADIVKDFSQDLSQYDMVINLGASQYMRFQNSREDCVKIQYWLPWDIDCLYGIAHKTARETIKHANEEITHNLCNEIASHKRLEDLGIQAEVVSLPTEIDDLEKTLPEAFRVLVDADKGHLPVVADLRKALPNIQIDYVNEMGNMASIPSYSLLISLYESPTVDEAIRRFLLNGRHIISNVEAPFCGYLDLSVNHAEFKNELINRIFDARVQPFNERGQAYYMKLVNPLVFLEKMRSCGRKPELAVVA